ncbi:MAG TPA: hypothetical protein VFJ16_01190 [Longimicrobium sp.]|nr:hypothetical protein [Longimicrobium sp.]
MTQYVLPATAFVAGALAMPLYNRVANRYGIIAKMNARTLHERIVPRGGGSVFAMVFCLGLLAWWLLGGISTGVLLAFALGGGAAATIGFVDDVHELRAGRKLLLHVMLSLWLLAALWKPVYAGALDGLPLVVRVMVIAALLWVPVWLINLYNFIDGIDGLAVSAGVLISSTALAVLVVTGGSREFILVAALLAACALSFLFWNLPPAHVFMGDAGSIFLGYSFAALILATVVSGQITPWTWIATMGYYVADTTTTTLCRMVLVERWYGGHRSHAYQNLARIHRSHGRVTYGIAAYQLLWAIPLAFWSALQPRWGILAAALAVVPAVLWTLRYGPPLSSD